MKWLAIVTALAITLAVSQPANAKFFGPRSAYGISIGGARGDMAGNVEEWKPQIRAHFQTKIFPLLSTQLGVNYTELHATGGNSYETKTLGADFRLLMSPFRLTKSYPFLYAGLGVTKDQGSSDADYLPIIPFGIGIQTPMGDNLLLQVTGDYNLSMSDKMAAPSTTNRVTNDKNDAYFGFTVGLIFGNYKSDMGEAKKTEAVKPPKEGKDTDHDGLSDASEKEYGTDPKNPDSDGDGLTDGDEVRKHRTNPLKTDSDGDGLADNNEVSIYRTDPLKADTDGDVLNDGVEVTQYKTDPIKADTDSDGLTDSDEINKYRIDPLKADSDSDGLNDGDEVMKYKSDPLKSDADGDGIKDGDEALKFKTDPIKTDTEGDGLTDGDELNKYRTDPLKVDTDDGGMNDGAEIKFAKNPLDPKDDLFDLTKGKKVVLRGINFATNKSAVLPESEYVLEKARASIEANPDVTILISGHTDNVGSDEANRTLSQKRAQSVKDWLVSKGIDSGRLKVVGKGETEPMSTNETEEGRAENRRMEFFVE